MKDLGPAKQMLGMRITRDREAGEVSGAQKGCHELVFVSECLFGVIIKGSFTCKALEGQVQEDRKLWDVEPLEGRHDLLREK